MCAIWKRAKCDCDFTSHHMSIERVYQIGTTTILHCSGSLFFWGDTYPGVRSKNKMGKSTAAEHLCAHTVYTLSLKYTQQHLPFSMVEFFVLIIIYSGTLDCLFRLCDHDVFSIRKQLNETIGNITAHTSYLNGVFFPLLHFLLSPVIWPWKSRHLISLVYALPFSMIVNFFLRCCCCCFCFWSKANIV